MATPAERFRLRPLAKGKVSVPVDPREDRRGQWVLRRVGSNGMVSVDNQLFSVTQAFNGKLLDVFVDGTTIQAWSKNHLIKTVAHARAGRVRKIRADGLHVNTQPNTKDKHQPELDTAHDPANDPARSSPIAFLLRRVVERVDRAIRGHGHLVATTTML